MNTVTRYYSPDQEQQTEGGSAADNRPVDPQQTDTPSSAASDAAETAGEGSSQDGTAEPDSTILGVGPNRAAGGLSGDGSRTDEYDAAVMGIGD
ncbi:hypothetical protein [Spirosoma koreense]